MYTSFRAGLVELTHVVDGAECRLTLDGEIDRSNLDALERALTLAGDSGAGRTTIDLGRLAFIDAGGARALRAAAAHLAGVGDLRVEGTRRAVRRTLSLTGPPVGASLNRDPEVSGALAG